MNNIENTAYSNRVFENNKDLPIYNKLDEGFKLDNAKYTNVELANKSKEFKQKDAENK